MRVCVFVIDRQLPVEDCLFKCYFLTLVGKLMAKNKVFGIGLNKTGTTTLGVCMNKLGYRHLSCRRDLLKLYRRGHADQVMNYMDGFDSFDDWPYPLMYRELWARFGDSARYILTTRSSSEKWLRSLENHARRSNPLSNCRKLAYGYHYPQNAPEAHLAFYESHNAEVRAFFAELGQTDLLLEMCWEKGHGWDELCGFLGEPVPDEPMPMANVTATRAKSGYESVNGTLLRLTSVNRWLTGRRPERPHSS